MLRPAVNLENSELLAERLLSMVVEETVDGICRCELTFQNWLTSGEDYLYFDRSEIDFGLPLTVTMTDGASATTAIFQGKIMGIEGRYFQGRMPEIAVLAEDQLQQVRMTRRTRTFTDVTDADAISQVASDAGLSASVSISGGPTHPVLVQANQSDLAFILERARANGAEVWIDGTTVNVAPRSSRTGGGEVTLTYGDTLWEFSALGDLAGQTSQVTVTGWDRTGKQLITQTADSSAISAELSGLTGGTSTLEKSLKAWKEQVVHTTPASDDEALALAQAIYRRGARRFVTGAGVATGNPAIRVGSQVTLEGLGTLFSGTYYVVEARHLFDTVLGYRTQFRVERPGIGG
jgi:uncharacterized protein